MSKGANMRYFHYNRIILYAKICLYFDSKEKKIISPFCQIVKDCSCNVDRLFQNDDKLPYLH